MTVGDYLIDHAAVDWATVLAGWCPPLPEGFTVWLLNRFGDLFIVYEDGSVHRLSPDSGNLDQLAASRSAFCDLIDIEKNANDWLMIPLVDRCMECGIALQPGQCYSLAIPAVLGGKYSPENIKPLAIAEYFSFMADLHRQIRDLPDGTQAKLIVK